jgi:hypothetical protein
MLAYIGFDLVYDDRSTEQTNNTNPVQAEET